jgi:nucleoside-diphosphate-sugar epimerase
MDNPLQHDLDHILTHTQGLWEELRGKRIFITGGTGFFGCWLLESLAWANDKLGLNAQAVVLTRNPAAFARKVPHLASHRAIQCHVGDIRDFTFPSGRFSHVIHAATEASAKMNAENPLLMFETIVRGTWRTLDFAVQCGADKILLTSSGAVYGRQPADMTHIPEDYHGAPDPTDPLAAYGEGKRVAELLCCAYARKHGLEPKIARCFAFVGPYLPLDRHYAIGNFIRDALNGGPIVVRGDGMPRRSYLYASDLVIWLWKILFHGVPERPYNVGNADARPIADLARCVDTLAGGVSVQVVSLPSSGHAVDQYVPNISRAERELNLLVRVNLAEALRRTMEHHRAFRTGGE